MKIAENMFLPLCLCYTDGRSVQCNITHVCYVKGEMVVRNVKIGGVFS